MTDYRQMRPTFEAQMPAEGQMNAGGMRRVRENGTPYYDPAPMSEYPRMLYKATIHEQTQEWADRIGELKDAPYVINRFDGLLCETCIASSATEAEALAELGWDISPQAAHGIKSGLVAATTAKDERIAELEAQLRASLMQTDEPEAPRRGPGRPPKHQDA